MREKLALVLMLAAMLMAPAVGHGQRVELDLDTKSLAAKAEEIVEVTLEGELLRLASRFLAGEGKSGSAGIGRMVARLEGIYVRSYSFASEGAYDRAAIEQFRSRIGPGWKRIVNVSSPGRENIEIYASVRNDAIQGLVVIAAEPRELTFVNIVGPIDLEDLGRLEGQFGIPRIALGARKKEK